jgi:hypothetical protein
MKKIVLIALCASIMLSGCATLEESNDPERIEQVTGIDKHSSYPAVRRKQFEKINLLELVDPEKEAGRHFKENWDMADIQTRGDSVEGKVRGMGAKYDLAMAWFRQRHDISDEEKSRLRNSIQERILSVSISRCDVFKTYLRRDQADKNFMFGSATTVASVLGAVLPGADAARYLSGTAGLFSGLRSEYNQAYFASLAAHVIAKGIETRQEIVYRQIQNEGQTKPIDAYPLEAAIKDAIYFDGLCSVVEGIDQASASIDATTEPGMEAAMRTVLRARLLKEAADMPREMLLKPGTLESIDRAGGQLGLSLVGSTRGEPLVALAETDLFVAASKMVDRISATADSAALVIEQAFLDRKEKLLAKLQDPEVRKKQSEMEPKEGSIVKEIRPRLMNKLLAPLKLDACYSKLAAGAIEQRLKAAEKKGKAKSDVERATADLEIGEASRAIAAAHEKLRTKERLVMLEIAGYRDEQIAAVQKVELMTQEVNQLTGLLTKAKSDPPGPTGSTMPSCAE